MSKSSRSTRTAVVLLAIVAALPPVVAYWTFLGRTPTIAPEEAKQVLSDPETAAVLVDVRSPEEFAKHHLDAARNWPYEQISALSSAQDVSEELRGKRLMLICESGILSGLATRHLQQIGATDALNVEGGMQIWVATADRPCILGLCQIRTKSGAVENIPSRPSSQLEQGIAVFTGFFVKPLYTVISLAIFLFLWRQSAPDLTALRWAMICFFVGENFCAANYLGCGDRSVLFEYLHSYGMVLCFGLTTYALLEGIDLRLLKLSNPESQCAALGLCRRCIKHADAPCGLRRVFQFLIPAMMTVSLAPLCADMVPNSYNTTIFGTFYNYSHPIVHQVFEVRYLPAAAFVLLGVSLLLLRPARPDAMLWPKIFFAAGIGAMGFSFFRLFLLDCYRDNLLWFASWEEFTEMLFILGVVLVLWTFRHSIFSKPARRVPVQ
jgi:phage shock protein E